MEYDEFTDRFLVALYVETEQHDEDYVRAASIIEKYNLQPKRNWISRMADEWEHSNFKDISKVLGSYEGWSFRISAEGYRKVESEFLDLNEMEQFLSPSDNEHLENPPKLHSSLEENSLIDAANWTGRYSVSSEGQQEIVKIFRKIEMEIDNSALTNSDKSNAKALVEAADKLIAAPDPQWTILLQILSSPMLANFAALAALAIAIIKP